MIELRETILKFLYEHRGLPVDIIDLVKHCCSDTDKIMAELDYLIQDGQVEAIDASNFDQLVYYINPRITAKGIRIIEKNEEYIVVKLHDDTLQELRALLIGGLAKVDLPEKEKGALKKAIESAQDATISSFVSTLLAAGFDSLSKNGPALLQRIQSLF